MKEFIPSFPCNASELLHLCKRIREKGIEFILTESIRVNEAKNGGDYHDTVFIDSTVEEKNLAYPTDSRLHRKLVSKVLKLVNELNLPLRYFYIFILKEIYRDQYFRTPPKN